MSFPHFIILLMSRLKKISFLIFLAIVLAIPLTIADTATNQLEPPETTDFSLADDQQTDYLPIILNAYPPYAPILLGIYPDFNWWQPDPQGTLDNQFKPLEQWSGKKMSIAGIYHNLEDTNIPFNVTFLFDVIWENGYTPFANLYAYHSAWQIARGDIDHKIREWAQAYAAYARGGERVAFLAPLQEMNGDWTPYGMDPPNYILAYQRIQQIFAEENVPDGSVIWVFAPNGFGGPQNPPLESYYPGDHAVDVVAFSSYNFGYHPDSPFDRWYSPWQIYQTTIERLRLLAPDKAIIIAQTGTTAFSSRGWNIGEKNAWLRDAFEYIPTEENVRGVIYFNADIDFDWTVYEAGVIEYFTGYLDGVSDSAYGYLSPAELRDKGLPPN